MIERNMESIKAVSLGLSNWFYANDFKNNGTATKELMDLFDTMEKSTAWKGVKLSTPEDYIRIYDNNFYTYKTWEELVESEKEQSYDLTEDELKTEIGNTIFQLPCGWYVQYV